MPVKERTFNPHVPGIPGDGSPVVLHIDEARGLTFTWFDISRNQGDWNSRERGYLVSCLAVTDVTGAEVGYLKVTHTTAEMVAAELPTAFHWADENTGGGFGFHWREPSPQHIWATAYGRLKKFPPSMNGKSVWVLSEKDAPTDPDVLAAELADAEAEFNKQITQFIEWLSVPFVDFSRLNETSVNPAGETVPLRGTGIGQVMYRLAAQRLAEQGKVLRASGIQSPEAEAVWKRLVADRDVPTREVTLQHWASTEPKTYVCIDFTEQRDQVSAVVG